MARTTARNLMGKMAVAILVLSTSAGSAWAGWGNGSSGGSSGSSGGSWGSSGGSWGSSGGSSGSSGGGLFARLHHNWHHNHCWRGNHHSSGGSWGSSGGSHGSSGGSHGSSGGYTHHGSSGGYSTYHGSSGGTYYSTPSNRVPETREKPSTETPADDAPADLPKPSDSTSYRTGQAILSVAVPEDARVFVNGVRTVSTGKQRQYVSRGLVYGYTYTYEVRVELERDGQIIEESKTAYLRVGENSKLAFDMTTNSAPTVLTLKVPSDAKVFLGGNETRATGSVRTFSTTNLRDGQEWSSYKVRVEWEQNGETLVKESTIALKSGDQRTLEVGFDTEKVATRN